MSLLTLLALPTADGWPARMPTLHNNNLMSSVRREYRRRVPVYFVDIPGPVVLAAIVIYPEPREVGPGTGDGGNRDMSFLRGWGAEAQPELNRAVVWCRACEQRAALRARGE